MAKVKETVLMFVKSDSPDVIGYALYVEEVPVGVTYASDRIELGSPQADGNGTIEVSIQELEGMTTRDGVYNLGIVAVDDAGNESSMEVIQNVALDFSAPNPPTSGRVERR